MKDNKTTQISEKKRSGKQISARKVLIFTFPPILLALYIGFFVVLVPVLYGGVLSFIDFVSLDADNIICILRDIGAVLSPIFAILAFVVLHFVILSMLVTSLYFMCRELQNSDAESYNCEAAI